MNTSVSLTKAIQGYKIAKISEGYSQDTLISYESRLRHLARHLSDADISTITANDLKQFLYYLRSDYTPNRPSGDTSPITEAGIHGFWKAFRSFWSWLNEEFGIDPVANELKMPEYTSRPITPFTEAEIKRLLSACEYTATAYTPSRGSYKQRRPSSIRDKAIVLILLDTGIRVSEFARLRIEDIDLESGLVKIRNHGRGRKSKGREVYIGNVTKRITWRYLSSRDTGDSEYLFLSNANKPLSKGAVKNLIRRIGNRCDVKAHPHKFRHTFAIQYLRNGGDIFTLQRLLGHSSLGMVKRYLSLAQSDIREAHRKASPVDSWGL